ncbi:hypothetical protein Ais01nite_56230 [Asanoa ishikariensis]|uniref:Uncharacterized protein n=1 Tax=Asanoa ishikariensis TaxID=137265 RepID=A0A1H3TVX7_9ACTN|nr:DUF6518 family protein [Asanoa ishikariensis]GIF67588.1 hypothetical protein Ais01nite_56230 [Asanoa ishikariensis]SDZ54403.1 hypothetical protein SAMN05421684_6485 [Asanoa ishikariensis]
MRGSAVLADRRVLTTAAVVCGFALGFLDFVWIKFVPSPFADLGNSSAVWAVAAFAFGWWVRTGVVRAAAAAAVLLVVAVPSYYLAALLIQHDALAVLWAPSSLLWMFFGILAGVVFGIAGVWARTSGWRLTVGAALPAAVLFAEAALQAGRIGDPNYGDEPVWLAVIRAVLGLLIILVALRSTRQRALVLGAAVPLALVGLGAFTLAGFA